MTEHDKKGALQDLEVTSIRANDDNPRLIFRAEELEDLADSIQEIGVQVPISVFKDGSHYVLIDGERRWRACRKINRELIPAIIYPKPSEIKNIVYMFNIHRFRRDWDPLPTAIKLEHLIGLIEKAEGKVPTEAQLSALTGMSRGAIRRCRLILEIAPRDRKEILDELEKPESERRVSTDLFIEAQRAVKAIGSYIPSYKKSGEQLRRAVIAKYRNRTIVNLVHMRMLAKIGRAVKKGVPEKTAVRILNELTEDEDLTLEEAFGQISWAYDLKAIQNQARSLTNLIDSLPAKRSDVEPETLEILRTLRARITALLG